MAHYRRKAFSVDAVQIEHPKIIPTTDHPSGERFKPTDWLVTESNGDTHKCEDGMFRLKFERVEPPGNK